MDYELFISCGDPSADLHSANLVKVIKNSFPGLKITSIGGQELKKVSDNFLFNLVDLNLHGFWSPVKHYFELRDLLYRKIYNYLKISRPSVVIPVDFYGFNINLCKISHELGLKVFYYISPQIWATRPNRINKLKRYIDHMFAIFRFEEKIYRDAGIPVTFVGHPLLDLIPEDILTAEKQKPKNNFYIGLFPGSREPVIRWNLPMMLKAAELIKKSYSEVEFIIVGLESLKECYKNCSGFKVDFNCRYDARTKFDIAISTSGTVTLENALLGIPMIVTYRLPWMMYFLIKSMIRISTITIVNLIVNEQLVPEFIQDKAKPENVAKIVLEWIQNRGILEEIKAKYSQLRKVLGEPGSYRRTANLILENL